MLSGKEREYLLNPKKFKPGYRRDLNYSIRKKVPQAMRDLTLIFQKLDPTQLHFYKKDYYEIAIPLLKAIQVFELEKHFFEDVQDTYLAMAFEKAGKRYNFRRLAMDEKYKQRMIDWLVKNGIEFWNPPELEEQKRRLEKLKRMMGEPEVSIRSL